MILVSFIIGLVLKCLLSVVVFDMELGLVNIGFGRLVEGSVRVGLLLLRWRLIGVCKLFIGVLKCKLMLLELFGLFFCFELIVFFGISSICVLLIRCCWVLW